jgi:hypothetical protein
MRWVSTIPIGLSMDNVTPFADLFRETVRLEALRFNFAARVREGRLFFTFSELFRVLLIFVTLEIS